MNGHPEQLTELEAVNLAHEKDIARAAALLDDGLSVLVHVTQDLVPDLTAAVAARCARAVRVVDIDGTATDQMGELARALADAMPHEAVIIPNLDVLAGDTRGTMTDEARRATMLLRRTAPRALLAFLGPWLILPDILQAQFEVHLVVDSPPPLLTTPAGLVPLGRALVTRAEAAMFTDFAEAHVYPHVAGLSVVQIRRLLTALSRTSSEPAWLTLAQLGQEASGLRLPTIGSSPGSPAVLEAPSTGLAEVQGYADVKSEIGKILALLRDAPRPFVPQGLLLHGPAGTGKTMMARAVAGELSATAVLLRCREVPAGTAPASAIRQVFAQTRRLTPSVLVLDDLDTLDDAGAFAILNEITAAADRPGERTPLLVIGTATRLDGFDELLTRAELLRPLLLSLPDLDARSELAEHFAERYGLSLSRELREAVAQASIGFSGEDMRAVFYATRSSLLAGDRIPLARKLGEQVGRARRTLEQSRVSSPPTRRTRLAERVDAMPAVPLPEESDFAKRPSGQLSVFSKSARTDQLMRADE